MTVALIASASLGTLTQENSGQFHKRLLKINSKNMLPQWVASEICNQSEGRELVTIECSDLKQDIRVTSVSRVRGQKDCKS